MKRWIKFSAGAALSLPLLLLSASAVFEKFRAIPQDEQYAVYSDYLSASLRDNDHDYGAGACIPRILDYSTGVIGHTESSIPVVERLRRDLFAVSLRPVRFERKFHLPGDYELIPDAPSAEQLDSPKPGRCGGYITFSRVAFDRRTGYALFYTEHLACGLCGGGEGVLMRKQWGHWVVAEEYGTWSS